jgi:hypothetical protein
MWNPNGHVVCFLITEETPMNKLVLNLPTLAFIAATRGLLGAGIGLLASGKLSKKKRREVGMTLAAIGAVATIPAIFAVVRGRNEGQRRPSISGVV